MYQWHKEGEAIAGAEAQELAFENLATTDASSYTVSISNEAGTVVSDSVAVTVHVPITITQQPVEARVIEGETTSFTVTGGGDRADRVRVAIQQRRRSTGRPAQC